MAAQEVSPGRREVLLGGIVEYVLDHGVAGLSLRPLAAALQTSDRMLLYYFGTREALIAAVLQEVANRLRSLLSAALPPEPQPPAVLLATALSASDDPSAMRLLALWLQVVAGAGTGEAVFAETAAAVVEDWIGWFADRIEAPDDQRRAAAAAVLVVIDGLVLFEAAGADDDARQAAGWLVGALSQPAAGTA